MDATNDWFPCIYFILMVLFGTYFLLNLILAVIIEAYMKIDLKEKKREQKRLEEEAKNRERKMDAIKTVYRMIRLT